MHEPAQDVDTVDRSSVGLQGRVLGGDPLDGVLGPLGFQVADLAEELADPGTLTADLGVGALQGVFGVEGPFPPGGVVLVSGGSELASVGQFAPQTGQARPETSTDRPPG
jgi:hypothetical protein